MKRCIFHYPHPVADEPGIGSALRPRQMRAALAAIGYEVDEIVGYGAQRKQQIAQIRRNIRAGVKYDFVYSESVNIPMMLTEADHLPRYPFQDFSFFRFCGKQGIPVGLFYRDMHWKFPVYRQSVARWKQMITLPLFRYDLRMYRKYVDLLYVPSLPLGQLLPKHRTKPLPPGGIARSTVGKTKTAEETLNVFYVGNVLGVYDVTAFCQAVAETEQVGFTICTPRESWEQAKHRYAPYLCDRIRVVHKSSGELAPFYEAADVFCCCLQANEYTRLAMPIKTFESIGYGVPVMMTEGIAAQAVIAQEDCGWITENTAQAYRQLLRHLLEHPEEIRKKKENTVAAAAGHTWESRARQVAEDLTNLKK